MEDNKKSSYNGYTNARKEANKRYMKKFVEMKVRTTSKHRETVKNHASNMGESTTSFIIRAINETIERDNQKQENMKSSTPVAASRSSTTDISKRTSPAPSEKKPKKQEKYDKAFTEAEVNGINLSKLLKSIKYQLDIADVYGTEVLSSLMEKARQQAAETDTPDK